MKVKKKSLINRMIALLGGAFIALSFVSKAKSADSVFENEPEQKNSLEGKKVIFVEDNKDAENADGARGHLEAVGDATPQKDIYQSYTKRGIDIALSFCGLVILSPVLAATALAIVIDDPGPVLFTQKRIGQNKKYFKLHKFRSMKMSTPHDVPTHMLDDPDQYITRVGKFLRAHSLDELPQIWDIFIGNMSIIGPRPALWNQDVLTSERDKYGANDIKPGLTGWAQINGRDELTLTEKAKLDGEYTESISKGGIKAFLFDCRCFIYTLFSVAKGEGVVEGGTGAIQEVLRPGVPEQDPDTPLGCDINFTEYEIVKKKVLITGEGSYIGESVKKYAEKHYPNLEINTIDTIDGFWRQHEFCKYDCVYHVAGIAHADVESVSDEVKEKYYAINTDLAIETANKARAEGVKQFIFMSSMIIYGDSAPYGKKKRIDRTTKPSPDNFYGDSKWQADKGIRALAASNFKVAVLRPPMIYGKGSKGNYLTLSKIAKKAPLFPDANNERSMLYIENLSEFICKLIMTGEGGIYYPQNDEYVRTSNMVKLIAEASGHRIIISKVFNPVVALSTRIPGRIGKLSNKAFGNLSYSHELSTYSFDYSVVGLEESILKTEA